MVVIFTRVMLDMLTTVVLAAYVCSMTVMTVVVTSPATFVYQVVPNATMAALLSAVAVMLPKLSGVTAAAMRFCVATAEESAAEDALEPPVMLPVVMPLDMLVYPPETIHMLL